MATRRQVRHKFVGKLSVDTEFGTFLGDTRIRLLEAIDRYGSITQAAKAVPISYKAAWDAVQAMNNVAEQALVLRSAGGRHGGGTVVTEYGRRLISMYRAVEQDYQVALDRLSSRLGETGAGDVREFQGMLRKLAIKTSARNQYAGPISSLRDTPAGFEVRIRIDTATELAATITQESAESLGLQLGLEVHAFVKASSVALRTEPEAGPELNHFWGTVAHIHEGPVHHEVCVALPGVRSVTAIATPGMRKAMTLAVGAACCAIIDPATVILVLFQ